jgi:NTP pyrophosphatase (non-canonical NTP hydrolase)
MTTRDALLNRIRSERCRQINKFGHQQHPNYYWLSILAEEVGELAKEIVDFGYTDNIMMELVQIAAVCVAWLEDLEEKGKMRVILMAPDGYDKYACEVSDDFYAILRDFSRSIEMTPEEVLEVLLENCRRFMKDSIFTNTVMMECEDCHRKCLTDKPPPPSSVLLCGGCALRRVRATSPEQFRKDILEEYEKRKRDFIG